MQLSVCAKRNIVGRRPTSLMRSITSFAACRNIVLCPQADNDVFAMLIMMLTFGQMMLCPTDTNEKSSFRRTRIFGSPCWARTKRKATNAFGVLSPQTSLTGRFAPVPRASRSPQFVATPQPQQRRKRKTDRECGLLFVELVGQNCNFVESRILCPHFVNKEIIPLNTLLVNRFSKSFWKIIEIVS